MDTSRSTLEESIFGQTGSNNEVATTRYAKPAGWAGNSSSQVSRLGTTSGHNIGPNALQKVMAGDKITATVLYYHEGSPGGNNTSMVNTLIGSLSPIISGSSGATGAVKSNATGITSQLGSVNGFINAVQPNGSNPSSSTPQAFLTILFFDERFNFIEAADGGAYQQQVAASVGSNGSTLTLLDKKAPKNGYVYVYVSNQSNNHVYFDDFNVTITQGNIVEENHYYSYGLKIAAISSRKFSDSYEGLVKNNYLYQGAYSEMDDDIGWNDFALRNYDPQIGRWVQQDPYEEYASPYSSMGTNPIKNSDPSGGSVPIGGLSTTAEKAITLSEVVVRAVRPTVHVAAGIVNVFDVVSTVSHLVSSAMDILSNFTNSPQVGGLEIGGNLSQALSDIKSLLPSNVQNCISLTGTNNIDFDIKNLSAKDLLDPGVKLLEKLTNPRAKKTLYSVSDNVTLREVDVDMYTGKMKDFHGELSNPSEPYELNLLGKGKHGIENANRTPYGPDPYVTLPGPKPGSSLPFYRNYSIPANPKFYAAIYISNSGDFIEYNKNKEEVIKSRSSIVFHELSESFYRSSGMDYNNAHEAAIKDEMALPNDTRKSLMPGAARFKPH